MTGPSIFLWIAASAAAVIANGTKTRLANGLSKFFIKGNPPDWPISWIWVFNNFILADEPFEKTLQSLETCV